jgi:hypothetical protein
MEGLFFSGIECGWYNDRRQTEIDMDEPVLPESSSSDVEIAVKNRRALTCQALIKFRQN